MLQIQYGRSLTKEIKDNKPKSKINGLFQLWTVDIIDIKGKKYYLLVEKVTGMPLLLTNLEVKQFHDVVQGIVKDFTFIIPTQQNKLIEIFKTDKINFVYNNRSTTVKAFKSIKDMLENNIDVFLQLTDLADSKTSQVKKLVTASAAIPTLNFEVGNNMLIKLIFNVNETFPIPASRGHFIATTEFEDLLKWKQYEGKAKRGNAKIVKEVRKNNLKMYWNFMQQDKLDPYTIEPGLLADFLNYYLLQKKILFPTSNLAEATSYIWLKTVKEQYYGDLLTNFIKIFIEFYRFLAEVGLITKKDANLVAGNLHYLHVELQKNNDYIFRENPLAELKLENKSRNNMTYEINVQLRDFKPVMWRQFIISGSSTVAELEQTILYIFNAEFGHMYDLYNLKCHQRFGISTFDDESLDPEKAKVSFFTQNTNLLLVYDYGDNWQFDVKIEKVYQSKQPLLHSQIIAGKGYGIIDDIGGVYELQEYYDTPKNKLDPDLLDWLGERIDLDKFDMDNLNMGLAK